MCEAAPLQYSEETVARLEMLWGKGFMSVGGPEEVSAILDGVNLKNLNVLDIGCGIGGVDFLLVSEHGAASVLGLDVEPHLLELAQKMLGAEGYEDWIALQVGTVERLAARSVQPTHIHATRG
jgi:ubiquinone/menaquinone biosynthesis C-methylase UbiE